MDVKGLAELADNLIYEVVALVLPGAAFLLGIVGITFPEVWPEILTFASVHPWLSMGTSYAAGYLIQGISRPICSFTSTVFAAPFWLLRVRTPRGQDEVSKKNVNLRKIEKARWVARLGLADDAELSTRDILNLSFSTLGDERRRLGRFRAIVSCCRALASLCALAFWGLVAVSAGPWPITSVSVLVITALAIAFLTFRERENMYNDLWNEIITAQFLSMPTGAFGAVVDPGSTAPPSNPSSVTTTPTLVPTSSSVAPAAKPPVPKIEKSKSDSEEE